MNPSLQDYKKAIDQSNMYRRQLGGTNAALNRSRQQNKDLVILIKKLYEALPASEALKFEFEVNKVFKKHN